MLTATVLWLVRRILSGAQPRTARPVTPGPREAAPVQLYRDPLCGTHVSPEISFKLDLAGHTEHFCSPECRDRYLGSHRQAASA